MRTVSIIPIVIAISAAVGYGLCAALGWNPHPREMLFASIAIAVAGSLATIPMRLTRGASQIVVVQAALVGTIVHLFGSLAVAMIVLFAQLAVAKPFLFWLLWLYWITLFILVMAFVKSVRGAPVGQVSSH
ncbi:hypothetical protein BH09PLA1_BH09PLA1_33770 [soil metagenome]